MKNGTNNRLRPNPKDLLERNLFQEALDYAEERQQDIFTAWLELDEEDFRANLRYEYALLDETADFLHTDEPRYAILRLGSLLGTVESFERVLFERREDQWAQARFQKEAMQVKHLPEVIRALETHGAMFHAELGEYLGLNPPTLTEAMKKVLDTGAVQVSRSGKYKIYTLTDAGLRYGRELRKQKRSKDPLEEALQVIRNQLKNMNSEAERSVVKTTLRDMAGDMAVIESRSNSIRNMWCQPVEKNVLGAAFLAQAASTCKNMPPYTLISVNVKTPHFSQKPNVRELYSSNSTPAAARA